MLVYQRVDVMAFEYNSRFQKILPTRPPIPKIIPSLQCGVNHMLPCYRTQNKQQCHGEQIISVQIPSTYRYIQIISIIIIILKIPSKYRSLSKSI
jgi:hypothetical protein